MVGVKTVAVSGGFDPVHDGHVQLFAEAAKLGRVYVILNSDEWLKRKKGFAFMPRPVRRRILEAMKNIHAVVNCIDADDTVCRTLEELRPDIFLNGGDRDSARSIPEAETCARLGIELRFIGGNDSHSSVFFRQAMEASR